MPPDLPPLFIDRSVGGPLLRQALEAAGFDCRMHDTEFGRQNVPDVEWLAYVGERRWVILTADQQILRNELERRALHAAGTWALVLAARNQSRDNTVRLLSKYQWQIAHAVRVTAPPAAWALSGNGLRPLVLVREGDAP